MKLLKTIAKQFAFGMLLMAGLIAPVFANQPGGGGWLGGGFTQPDGSTPFTQTTDSASEIGVANSGQPSTDGAWGLIGAVKTAINWVLGLLALIALIICLWAGFKMLTSAGDTKAYGDAFTMLRQAGVGLILIGISWLLVSFVFWVIDIITNTGQ